MGFWKTLKLRVRFNTRLGAYVRARKAGLSEAEAREAVNREYPPTPDDIAFVDRLKAEDAARQAGR
jgi:hypothetical protein